MTLDREALTHNTTVFSAYITTSFKNNSWPSGYTVSLSVAKDVRSPSKIMKDLLDDWEKHLKDCSNENDYEESWAIVRSDPLYHRLEDEELRYVIN